MVNRQFDSVLIGDELLLVQCADILRRQGQAVAAIVSDNAAIHGYARQNGIRCLKWGDSLEQALAGIDYDWLFSIANLRIIPDTVWRRAKAGAVNFHDGPLPRYAGLNAPAWAILEGEQRHGVTWHAIASAVDEGEILSQELFEIEPGDTALTLNSKCFEAGIATFAELVERIGNGSLSGRAQDLGARSYYGRHRRPELAGTLDFKRSAGELDRLVRALDFGAGYANPLLSAKLRGPDGLYIVERLAIASGIEGDSPGTVLAISGDAVTIATGSEPVRLSARRIGDDTSLSATASPGMKLPLCEGIDADGLNAAVARAARAEERIRLALTDASDVDLIDVGPWTETGRSEIARIPLDLGTQPSRDAKALVYAAFILRLTGQDSATIAYSGKATREAADRFPQYFAGTVPLSIRVPADRSVAGFVAQAAAKLSAVRGQPGPLRDLPYRFPGLSSAKLTVGLSEDHPDPAGDLPEGCAFGLALGPAGDAFVFDRTRMSESHAGDIARRLSILARAFRPDSGHFDDLPLMGPDEAQRVLRGWNDTARDYDRACMHEFIERQAALTPDAVAVTGGGRSLSYRELDERANLVAHALLAQGVGPDVMVGLHLTRSVDLAVGALAIHKAGGAYVPLDPQFPHERIALMVEDAASGLVLTERALGATLTLAGARLLCIEDLVEAGGRTDRPAGAAKPENLAYVIYTSGSTGRPKGVMIEHRNVANFFAGMDERIPLPADGQPVWLAVTSISFDISVLELFWTLARGFKVVIHASETPEAKAGRAAPRTGKKLDFSLFYWGNDDGAGPAKYRLLLEGAKFADASGFQAIWTPERHFHAFGGPYPNPSVTGAAVAAVTTNLSIRAGSCVLPLHHPARVAEEWAVIDNISNGRVGLAFAAGWMPEDFLLRPDNAPPHNKPAMLRDIELVRRLWRGEKVDFPFGDGRVGVVTQPRPVQKELPVWITTAGNPETYRDAARLGAHVLTHLLGQSIEELAGKIAIYRRTLAEEGRNPADYKVTLMLHTLVGEDRDRIRELARQPMKDYLRSATALIKQYAWAFPAFKKPQGIANPDAIDLQGLDAAELDAILDFAFQRYFEDSGLFGTVGDACARVAELEAIGVDEVACLIDFGVPADTVLAQLEPLAQVVAEARKEPEAAAAPAGFAAEVAQHGVTHLQCTPSMARMFLFDEDNRAALGSLSHLFIGGEALPASLVAELKAITGATIDNMYGPTETTIWSSTAEVTAAEGVAPLGRPIANTQFYVLCEQGRPVPPGMPGELYIGGEGVARGYHNRPELNAERFLPNPFAPGRFYRTGDLVRHGDEGMLQFLGRTDHQVKIRGYRIELGEIEARIASFPGIAEVVVLAREDRADDVRLIAYLRLSGAAIDEAALRAALAGQLPGYMMPAHFVTLASFPLTPNAKVDRKALPAPGAEPRQVAAAYVAPADGIQREVAEVFRRILGVERVGLSDSFFALGGHSLLAVQAHRALKAGVAPEMTITDLFRFPTVSALAAHLSDRGRSDERLGKVADRAAMRRAALGERRAALARASAPA
jgi:natural product biosynthesis luciferase-like monooxygenase protein